MSDSDSNQNQKVSKTLKEEISSSSDSEQKIQPNSQNNNERMNNERNNNEINNNTAEMEAFFSNGAEMQQLIASLRPHDFSNKMADVLWNFWNFVGKIAKSYEPETVKFMKKGVEKSVDLKYSPPYQQISHRHFVALSLA